MKRGCVMSFAGRKVAVVGLAVNNTPLIRYLVNHGALVSVLDKKQPEELGEYLEEISDLPVTLHLGPDYLCYLSGMDIVFLSPGIPRNQPAIRQAKARGVEFSSELQLFLSLIHSPVIGVTGSSGKTTTTSLIGEMLTRVKPTKVGGNIGRPALSFLPEITEDTWVVLELSSFQLQELGYSPQIAVVTNVTPNHLDVHTSMEEYVEAKKEILKAQKPNDIAILNWDNDITRKMAADVKGRGFFFSRNPSFLKVKTELPPGAYCRGDKLYLAVANEPGQGEAEEFICTRNDIALLGEHNIENILAAALTARLAGVPREVIATVIKEFKGVEHRLEFVGEIQGVKYYNDSISTTPTRAIAGLRAIRAPIILLAGGYDKNLPFEDFAETAIERCRGIILFGATADKIRQALDSVKTDLSKGAGTGRRTHTRAGAVANFPEIKKVSDLREAITLARAMAVSGDVVLLSPGCASYDMFRNFVERGNLFKKLVSQLQA